MKMKETKERVQYLLQTKPHLRDNDYALMSNLWYAEMMEKKLQGSTVMDFLGDFAIGTYTHPESIRRTRAKLQQENPGLRGKKYNARVGKIQEEVRQDLGYDKNGQSDLFQ